MAKLWMNMSSSPAMHRQQFGSNGSRWPQVRPVTESQASPGPAEGHYGPEKTSHRQILKSSALIGFSTLINVGLGIIRIKAMAVWLGPAGFGLMGVYSSIADLSQSVAGMGVNASGVRQIAEAVGDGDSDKIARAVAVLRRTAALLGMFGAVMVVAFSRQISVLTFGDDRHAMAVQLLSATVLFGCMSGGQTALIRGMRRISDLVKVGILSAALGTIVSLPIVCALREDGIVPSLVCGAAISLLVSWRYSRKISIQTPSLTVAQLWHEASDLLKLGFALMASALMMTGASYAIRVFILRKLGFDAAGLYQSAWSVGGVYIGVILSAMGTDFYPRLTAAAKDNDTCNRLVNEQTHVGILLAAPGVIATLTLAPLVVTMFYSAKFQEAVDVLRWLCLGMALRVISWPMGYIIVARGARNLFFWSELAWTTVYVTLAWIGVTAFGLNGAGVALFVSYIFHVLMTYVIARKLSGFRCSAGNLRIGALFLGTLGSVFCGFHCLPYSIAMVVGLIALATTSIYCVRQILGLVSLSRIPGSMLKVLAWFRLAVATG